MPINPELELTPLPVERAFLRTAPHSADIESGPAPAGAEAHTAAGDTIAPSRWNMLPHFSSRAKSAAKAGGVLALLGGAFAAGHYDQAIAHAIRPQSHDALASSNAPASALAPAPAPALQSSITRDFRNETRAEYLARKYDRHGQMYVAKELREPYDDFLTYMNTSAGVQKTLARLETAPPYLRDGELTIDPSSSSDFDDDSNRLTWNSTMQFFFQSKNKVGTNSPAAVLLGLLKLADQASFNYGAYLARSAMAHPDHNTLKRFVADEALNRDLAAFPNENTRSQSTVIVTKNAANATDSSFKELSADEKQNIAGAAFTWNDTTAQQYAGNRDAFAFRTNEFYETVQKNVDSFDLSRLKAIDALIKRGNTVTLNVADARSNGTFDAALQQELENYTEAALAATHDIRFAEGQSLATLAFLPAPAPAPAAAVSVPKPGGAPVVAP